MRLGGRPKTDVLLVIDAQARLARDGRPLRDYDVLMDVTAADVIDRDDVAMHPTSRAAARWLGRPLGLAVLAVLRAPRYRAVYCDAESYGLLLGLLGRLLGWRTKITVMMHMPSHPAKRLLLKRLKAHEGLAAVLVNGSAVRDVLRDELGVPTEKIHVVPMSVDVDFWRNEAVGGRDRTPYISSAGQEFRDYPTLVEAARGLAVGVRIVAGSPYSTRPDTLTGLQLPANVEQVRCDTKGLRDVYAESALVVVPLADVESVAGVTTIVEAMSMGKCVVTTRSLGQADTVSDRRSVLRSSTLLPTNGTLVDHLGLHDPDLHGPTGFYVPVGDAGELRRVLEYLLSHEEVREELGRRGRRLAETVHDVRRVGAMIADVVVSPSAPRRPPELEADA